ncbi:MAG: glycosyltransferase family 39 protein [Candidatus Gottesmanbacteria bacterium]|nr:glycosyltransferase family 39 protein [Candidatus Gottesmanbacteria bacterium]
MAVFKRRWWVYVLLVAGLVALYAITRLTNLTKLPIFTDEAIYIRWSQIGSRDANWRFISLVDGKQPLFTWIMMVFLRVIRDPLVAGRLVSVMAGFFTTVGIFLTAHELFKSKKIGFIASFLYIVVPFGLVYDRMALYDSLVATFSIWNLYLAILLVRRLRLDIALFLGLSLGMGMLNKTSGLLSLYMLPGTLLLFDWQREGRTLRLLRWLGFAVLAAVISQLLYGVLRLSPLFAMVGQKDAVFVYSFQEWLTHPFNFLLGNIHGLFDWAIHYLTWPIFVSAMLAGLSFWKRTREKLVLLGWWFAPFFALAMLGRVLYPRFILFMIIPLMILAAVTVYWVWDHLRGSVWRLVLLAVLFFGSIYTDYYLITNPLYAPIPSADAGQYINDWPSGWGIAEVNAFLLAQLQKGKVTVYTDGTFGLLPYAIEIYLVDKPNMKIQGIYPIPQEMPEDILVQAEDHPTYIVFNQVQNIPLWPLKLIAEYQKGNRTDVHLRLYQIIPPARKL